MTEMEAYSIMARALIHAVASHRVGDGTHELFPEISEKDFEMVSSIAEWILDDMHRGQEATAEAYKFFSDRAVHDD